MTPKIKSEENQNPDAFQHEPCAKKRKSTGGRALKTKNAQMTSPAPQKTSNFTTQPTIDELIYPDATYQSFDEFDAKFNTWKDRHHHPFRVASSEALRTQEGTVSERFKYRYVVFHCARYGAPRMRGEGKRPNQNYLPCSCTAMIRLNFSYTDQCLKLTSLETRHSNHEVSKELYDRMVVKEKVRKNVGAVQKKVATLKKEMSEERTEDETFSDTTTDSQEAVAPVVSVAPVVPMVQTPAPAPPVFSNIQLLTDYRQNLQNQMVLNQMQLFSQQPTPYTPFTDWCQPSPMVNPFTSHLHQTSQQPSPSSTSSSADENEVPTFHSLETVRAPIALRPSENSAFHKLVPPPNMDQTALLLATVGKMLGRDVPGDVLSVRIGQLGGLVALWSQ